MQTPPSVVLEQKYLDGYELLSIGVAPGVVLQCLERSAGPSDEGSSSTPDEGAGSLRRGKRSLRLVNPKSYASPSKRLRSSNPLLPKQ